ncbi:type I-U CRISPR-associated RAMP protein Csb1/Cas7u [Streptomyces sp. GZWMJZ-114]|uniref:type I-G CRISPR-associated RAMP protein Csb1/Cas7g n=1 Tax=Streptomyces sp. GZWMJZ-114 TaxID=2494734 RepID=UPI0013E9726A|nr:type I-U CRISPR-associated RAMP protein Csb1/Cas7u [Streptomyces sp. GZWMJZ-114]
MITTDLHRIRFEVPLRPAFGSTFQPTGFPDIGAGTFDTFTDDGSTTPSLLVDSVQSMANRLEATAWDHSAQQPVDLVADLPYIRVHRASAPEEFLTSSRLEAHRIASAFVREATLDGTKMLDLMTSRLGLENDKPLNFPAMADALMGLDPFVLLHGTFFNNKAWWGQPRFTRAVSAVIEAHDVRRAVSGGRKSDSVRHALGDQSEGAGGTSEGYGSVPFHRVEWTAREIRAMFAIDTALLRSYGLGEPRTALLTTLALWEIRSFLDGGLWLRLLRPRTRRQAHRKRRRPARTRRTHRPDRRTPPEGHRRSSHPRRPYRAVERRKAQEEDRRRRPVITLALRFPWKRYHATPWGHFVNEGAVELPPSLWRILRALYSTWKGRCPDLDADQVHQVLTRLSSPPTYRIPPHHLSHSRHYFPDSTHRSGSSAGTDLALDAFAALGGDATIYVQ